MSLSLRARTLRFIAASFRALFRLHPASAFHVLPIENGQFSLVPEYYGLRRASIGRLDEYIGSFAADFDTLLAGDGTGTLEAEEFELFFAPKALDWRLILRRPAENLSLQAWVERGYLEAELADFLDSLVQLPCHILIVGTKRADVLSLVRALALQQRGVGLELGHLDNYGELELYAYRGIHLLMSSFGQKRDALLHMSRLPLQRTIIADSVGIPPEELRHSLIHPSIIGHHLPSEISAKHYFETLASNLMESRAYWRRDMTAPLASVLINLAPETSSISSIDILDSNGEQQRVYTDGESPMWQIPRNFLEVFPLQENSAYQGLSLDFPGNSKRVLPASQIPRYEALESKEDREARKAQFLAFLTDNYLETIAWVLMHSEKDVYQAVSQRFGGDFALNLSVFRERLGHRLSETGRNKEILTLAEISDYELKLVIHENALKNTFWSDFQAYLTSLPQEDSDLRAIFADYMALFHMENSAAERAFLEHIFETCLGLIDEITLLPNIRVLHEIMERTNSFPKIADSPDNYQNLLVKIVEHIREWFVPYIDFSNKDNLRLHIQDLFNEVLTESNALLYKRDREKLFEAVMSELFGHDALLYHAASPKLESLFVQGDASFLKIFGDSMLHVDAGLARTEHPILLNWLGESSPDYNRLILEKNLPLPRLNYRYREQSKAYQYGSENEEPFDGILSYFDKRVSLAPESILIEVQSEEHIPLQGNDFIRLGMLSSDEYQIIRAAMILDKSLLLSAKNFTSTVPFSYALTLSIPNDERIIVCDLIGHLSWNIGQEHVSYLRVRHPSEAKALVRRALMYKPNRLILLGLSWETADIWYEVVNEVPTIAFIQADSPTDALERLAFGLSHKMPQLGIEAAKDWVMDALGLCLHIQRDYTGHYQLRLADAGSSRIGSYQIPYIFQHEFSFDEQGKAQHKKIRQIQRIGFQDEIDTFRLNYHDEYE